MSTQASPVARWETALAQWVIPQHILDQAPESPCVHRLANFALGLGDTPRLHRNSALANCLWNRGPCSMSVVVVANRAFPSCPQRRRSPGSTNRRACCRALRWRAKMLVLPTAKYSVVGWLSRHTSCQPMLPCAITWPTTWPTPSHSCATLGARPPWRHGRVTVVARSDIVGSAVATLLGTCTAGGAVVGLLLPVVRSLGFEPRSEVTVRPPNKPSIARADLSAEKQTIVTVTWESITH